MNSHSRCLGKSPTHLYRLFFTKDKDYGDLQHDANWLALLEDIVRTYNLKIGTDWETTVSSQELFDHCKTRTSFHAIDYIYEKEAKHNRKDILFIKEVKTYKLLPALLAHDPTIQFVYQCRDPRDMALSWSKSPLHRGDIIRAAHVWSEDQYYSQLFCQSLEHKIIHHTYEELIADTATIAKKICSFIGIDFENGMLQHEKKASKGGIANSSDNWKNLTRSVMKNNSKKYAKALRTEQIQYVENACKKAMEPLGYEMDTASLNPTELATLKLELLAEERHEKPEYKNISEDEKARRIEWMTQYNKLHPNKFV